MKFRLIESQQNIEYDSEGNPLTSEQSEFFKDSKVRDEQGRLLVCYHGSRHKGFTTFEIINGNKYSVRSGIPQQLDFGFHFTSDKEYAQTYGKLYKCYLNIKNPKTIDDPFQNPITMNEIIESGSDGVFYNPQIHWSSSVWDESDPDYHNWKIVGTEEHVDIDPDSYIAFHSNQIKSTDNKYPTNSGNINEGMLNEEYLHGKTYLFRGESNNKWQSNYHNKSKDDLNSRYYSWEAFDGISNFGNVVVYELLDDSNLLDYGDSSAQFCIDYDLMEKEYPLLYKRYGVHCLEEIDNEEFNTERPTVKLDMHDAYHAFQLVATIYLETETNYSGCIWYEWIDTPEEQVQIWDNSIVRKLPYKEAKEVCTELAKVNPDMYTFNIPTSDKEQWWNNKFNLHR